MSSLRSGGWVCLLLAGLILLAPALATGRTIQVSPMDKSGLYNALASANYGDVVVVACGIYYEEMLYIPDGVTLTGTAGPACVQIKTSRMNSAFYIQDAGPDTRIENLTIVTDPDAMASLVSRGGGAYLENSSPVFSNVHFVDLEADYGGAIYCKAGSSPVFSNCEFKDNYARSVGGAVACTDGSSPQFEGCLFAGNSAETSGGTINAAMGSAAMLSECTIDGGSGPVGSGLSSWDSAGLVLDNVILSGGVDGRGWDGDFNSVPLAGCTDIYGNAGGDWVGALEPFATLSGNISADPEYCGDADIDHPYGLNESSPCAADANPGCGRIGAFDTECSFVAGTGGGSGLPVVSRLHGNYPNPFNPRTTIKFDLKQSGHVELAVFDVGGRLVKKLVTQTMGAGHHEAAWEGKDSGGRSAAAGVYFFRLKTADTIDTKRMTLIK